MKSKAHLLQRLKQAAHTICQRGWAEANAGNISLRLPPELALEFTEQYHIDNFTNAELFLVSRRGSRFRDMAIDPLQQMVLIQSDQQERLFPADANPTSEWITHKLLHMQDKQGQFPCLLHCHTTEIIALCHSELVKEEKLLNNTLVKILPELSTYLPEGIAFAPFAAPGSLELAECSLRCMGSKQVLIWNRHGLLVRGKDIDNALDLMEVVNKAAQVYMITRIF